MTTYVKYFFAPFILFKTNLPLKLNLTLITTKCLHQLDSSKSSMDLCSQENPPKCSEKLEDTAMLKRNVLSLTTLMTTDISRMNACPLMISISFIIPRMTEKAIKTSNL